MARIEIPIQTDDILDLAAEETAFDAADGAMFRNDGRTLLYLRNSGAGSHSVTITSTQTVGGLAVEDKVIGPIAAGDSAIIPFLEGSIFNQRSGTNKGFTYLDSDGTQTEMLAVAIRSY